MKIIITGTAGFIGFHLAEFLLTQGEDIVGVDNINDYYDVSLKYARLAETGIHRNRIAYNKKVSSEKYPNYHFVQLDITDRENLLRWFEQEKPDLVCHLAAQAGVRYSLHHPDAYISSNVTGFNYMLEGCRSVNAKLIYASSSSVYGLSSEKMYATDQHTDRPVSLYASTKKMNELMAHTYSYLYGLPTLGLRFFTVYGPWGRPDMAPFLFTKAILQSDPIQVYNQGQMSRDFTYVDDIVQCIGRLIKTWAPGSDPDEQKQKGVHENPNQGEVPYRIYNIGNGRAVSLLDFISTIERCLGMRAVKKFLPLQQGDMISTLADVSDLERQISYRPEIPISQGIPAFVKWYLDFYGRPRNKFYKPGADKSPLRQNF